METEPIILIEKLNDRHKRRQSQFEAEKLLDDLLNVVDIMYKDIFDDEIDESYERLYNFHLEQYGRVVEWNYKVRKPKFFRINENHFAELFKPIEYEINSTF